ncbi:MAG: hypothetical protein ACOQNV_00500 [Mycoplasmoidaceae bacterium]
MKKKTKIFLGSALAVTAGVVTPLVTLVSCGKDKPAVDPIVIKQKSVLTKSGENVAEFAFTTASEKKASQNIVCEDIECEESDWKIDDTNPIIASWDGKNGEFGVTLVSKSGDEEFPTKGTKVIFSANLSCYGDDSETPVWTKKFTGLSVEYTCEESGITPHLKSTFTAPGDDKAIGKITFDVAIEELPATAIFKVYEPTIVEQPKVEELVKGDAEYDSSNQILSIPFQLIGDELADDLNNDGSHVYFTNLRIVCYEDPLSNKVLFDKTFTDEFKVRYSAANVGVAANEAAPDPTELEAGVTDRIVRVYCWEELLQEGNVLGFDVIDADTEHYTWSAEKVDSGQAGDRSYIDVKVSATPKGKQPDEMLTYTLRANYRSGLISGDSEIVYTEEGENELGLWHINSKVSCDTKEIDTELDVASADYTINYEGELESGKSIWYKVDQTDGEATVGPTYEEEITSEITSTFNTTVNILGNNNQSATFDIIFYGKDNAGKKTWKQTIEDCTLTVKKAADIVENEILTSADEPNGQMKFTLNDPSFADDTFTISNKALDSSSTADVSIDDPSFDVEEGKLVADVELIEKHNALPDNAFAKFSFDLHDEESDWTKTFENVTVYYNGTIELVGEPELVTDIGSPKKEIEFKLLGCQEYLDMDKYEIVPSIENTSTDVIVAQDGDPIIDVATRSYKYPVKLIHDDPTNDYWSEDDVATFNINFTLKEKATQSVIWTKKVDSLSLQYSSFFDLPSEDERKIDLPEGQDMAKITVAPVAGQTIAEFESLPDPVPHPGQQTNVQLRGGGIDEGKAWFNAAIIPPGGGQLVEGLKVDYDVKVALKSGDDKSVKELIKDFSLTYREHVLDTGDTEICAPISQEDSEQSDVGSFYLHLAEPLVDNQTITVTLDSEETDSGVIVGEIIYPEVGDWDIEIPVHIKDDHDLQFGDSYNIGFNVVSAGPANALNWTRKVSGLKFDVVSSVVPEQEWVDIEDKTQPTELNFNVSPEIGSDFALVAEIEGPDPKMVVNNDGVLTKVEEGKYKLSVSYINPSEIETGEQIDLIFIINFKKGTETIYKIRTTTITFVYVGE